MAGPQHHILDRPNFDEPVKLLIVVAPYYKDIADNLVAGAKAEAEAAHKANAALDARRLDEAENWQAVRASIRRLRGPNQS